MIARRIGLKVVEALPPGVVWTLRPFLGQRSHSVDYTCGKCETILLHAEAHQVRGIQIHCANCGAFNSTDA